MILNQGWQRNTAGLIFCNEIAWQSEIKNRTLGRDTERRSATVPVASSTARPVDRGGNANTAPLIGSNSCQNLPAKGGSHSLPQTRNKDVSSTLHIRLPASQDAAHLSLNTAEIEQDWHQAAFKHALWKNRSHCHFCWRYCAHVQCCPYICTIMLVKHKIEFDRQSWQQRDINFRYFFQEKRKSTTPVTTLQQPCNRCRRCQAMTWSSKLPKKTNSNSNRSGLKLLSVMKKTRLKEHLERHAAQQTNCASIVDGSLRGNEANFDW